MPDTCTLDNGKKHPLQPEFPEQPVDGMGFETAPYSVGEELLERAKAGDVQARYELALWLNDNGDKAEGARWMRRAAQDGHPHASYLYGCSCQDALDARPWLQTAYDAGLEEACIPLSKSMYARPINYGEQSLATDILYPLARRGGQGGVGSLPGALR